MLTFHHNYTSSDKTKIIQPKHILTTGPLFARPEHVIASKRPSYFLVFYHMTDSKQHYEVIFSIYGITQWFNQQQVTLGPWW
jgi:hypothetical protein